MKVKHYELPALPYEHDVLEPVMSKEQLELHHDKHHKAYVDKANELLDKLEDTRSGGESADFGSIAKKLSFNIAGHTLHTMFWESLKPPVVENGPEGELLDQIESDFGSFERFKLEFQELATTIEGSGWAALTYSAQTGRLSLLQIGNHNLYLIPNQQIIFALDMWEHAYYVDYRNDKKKFSENFFKIINWKAVEGRFGNAKEEAETK